MAHETHWRPTAFYPLTRMSLMKERTQESTQLAELPTVILTVNALVNSWTSAHFYRLMGHCLRVVPSGVKNSGASQILKI